MNHRPLFVSCALLLLLISGVTSARAQVIFSDGPGYNGSNGLGGLIADTTYPRLSYAEPATIFDPTVVGVVTSVTFYGAYNNATAQPANSFEVYLYDEPIGPPSGPPAGTGQVLSDVTSSLYATASSGASIYQFTGTLTTPFDVTATSQDGFALMDTTTPASTFILDSVPPNYSGGAAQGAATYLISKTTGIGSPAPESATAFTLSGTVTPPPPPPPVVATTGTPTVVSANGGNYSTVAPVTSNGGYGTTVSLLDGTNNTGVDQTVTLASTNVGGNFKSLASDVVSVTGNDNSIFAVQLTFDLPTANQLGGPANMTVLWFNPATGTWENAVLGDHGSNNALSAQLDFQGSFDDFEGLYGTDLSQYLGAYGVDTTTNEAWAVIDHNSEFGVGNLAEFPTPSGVPEPRVWVLLVLGSGFLAFHRRVCRPRQS